uniref:Lox9 n=1 Tax=Arundo donax TaxID=35708 RepID=A0A0A8Y8M1_ARUDO
MGMQIQYRNSHRFTGEVVYFLKLTTSHSPVQRRKKDKKRGLLCHAHASYRDAIGHAAARDPRCRVGCQQLVRQHPGAAPVLPALIGVSPLDGLLGAPHVGREHAVSRDGVRVARPRRGALVAPFANVLLVGRVRRQRVHHGHELGGLQHSGHRIKEETVRVRQERRVIGRVELRVRQQPPHQRRAVRDVAAQRVLPEVERRMLRRREPDERGQDGGEVLRRRQRRPPGGVPEVGVPHVDRLVVPPLELLVGLDRAGVRVVELHVGLHPVANGRP